jgi:hypothetical protein
MYRLILVILLSFSYSSLYSESFDSSDVIERKFSESRINEFRKDKQLQYDKLVEPPQSLWNRFWNWVWNLIDRVFSTPGGRRTAGAITIILALAALIFFILKMGGGTALFGKQGKKGLAYDIGEENIHSISFEEAIQEALHQGNYRMAVRLVYLHSLKMLSDKELIDWRPGKTNFAYVYELNGHRSYSSFKNLTSEFEYTWYGGAEVDKEHFHEIDESFREFKNEVS